MLRLGSELRHLECVAWKPGELWETPWLRGHISEALLILPLPQATRGRENSATASRSVLQDYGIIIQDAAEAEWNSPDPKELQSKWKSTRNTWNHKEEHVRKWLLVQSSRQESHQNWHLNCLFALLSISWKHWNLQQGKESKYIEIKIYVMKKSSTTSLHLRNSESSKLILHLFSSCFHLSKSRERQQDD